MSEIDDIIISLKNVRFDNKLKASDDTLFNCAVMIYNERTRLSTSGVQLKGGSKEVTPEQLKILKHLKIKHDKDITFEKARYLINQTLYKGEPKPYIN